MPPEGPRGATITPSNSGSLAGRSAAPVVVAPRVPRIAPRVVAVDGEPAVHPPPPLSLTFDHRAVTGGEAARVLAALMADLGEGR